MRPAERFSRVGPESGTPRIAPARLRRPGARQGQPCHQGHHPRQQAPLSQPGQGLGPVQTFDVLDEGEDAAAVRGAVAPARRRGDRAVPAVWCGTRGGWSFSCPRCRFLDGCSKGVGSYRPVIAGSKLRESKTTILPEGGCSKESACLQCAFAPLAGARRRQRRTRTMVHGKNRISYRIDRRLTDFAGPDYDATISFGLPLILKTRNMGNTG